METLQATVRSLRGPYQNGWMIAEVEPEAKVVGVLGGIHPGDCCRFEGTWTNHAKFGRQFKAETVVVELPKDVQGIRDYLSRYFPWIGKTIGKKLIEKFGQELFKIVETNHERLVEISGITTDRAREIHETYLEIKGERDSDIWFAAHGITTNLARRLLEKYASKSEAIDAIKRNPYELADEIWGVGFKRADEIAMRMGVEKTSRFRIEAGIVWTLKSSGEDKGHCYLPEDELIRESVRTLEVNYGLVKESMAELVAQEKLVWNEAGIYLLDLKTAEDRVADILARMMTEPHEPIMHDLTEKELEELDADQLKALELSLRHKISIITGGPGTGKSYTIERIIRALGLTGEKSETLRLAAPTGKAAKRMMELTGYEAKTIHRLLEYSPIRNAFGRNAKRQIKYAETYDEDEKTIGGEPVKAIVIDETSMLDIRLMRSLVEAIHPETQVIFVGDVDQLPSVGPGVVLKDMIDAGIPTSRLRTLHRQAAESKINLAAQKINRGEKLTSDDFGKDFWFIPVEPQTKPEDEAKQIPELIKQAIPAIMKNLTWKDKQGEEHPFTLTDIQVLCPMKKGFAGTNFLNQELRPLFNPDGQKISGTEFQTGDRVIQTRNNYALEIFNGDIGKVQSKTTTQDYLDILFDDVQGKRMVPYPIDDLRDLQPAYALTIHKSQGSEFPCVIIPIHTTNFIMLKRNLLYTAITRGKKLVVLVGSMKSVNMAVKTVDSAKRYSGLGKKIQKFLGTGDEVPF